MFAEILQEPSSVKLSLWTEPSSSLWISSSPMIPRTVWTSWVDHTVELCSDILLVICLAVLYRCCCWMFQKSALVFSFWTSRTRMVTAPSSNHWIAMGVSLNGTTNCYHNTRVPLNSTVQYAHLGTLQNFLLWKHKQLHTELNWTVPHCSVEMWL